MLEGNKHSYFLRTKAARFADGEFKKPSSSSSKTFKSQECDDEEEDIANCLVMLSNKSRAWSGDHHRRKEESKGKEVVLEKGMFQCKACKKVFNSHQALGGHRASHKKVKGCFASKLDHGDEGSMQEDQEMLIPRESDVERPTDTRKRAKMHECSVCRSVFSSGQALGGHKRCHWLTTSTDNGFIPNFHDFHQSQGLCSNTMLITKSPHHQLDLNLNLPKAPQHDHHHRDDELTRHKASTRLCLQQWHKGKVDGEVMDDKDEEGCGVKLRKLSDLRDVNLDGGWLQMGIASSTEIMR